MNIAALFYDSAGQGAIVNRHALQPRVDQIFLDFYDRSPNETKFSGGGEGDELGNVDVSREENGD